MSDDRQLEVLASDWTALRPHHQRGALLLATPEVDLLTVSGALRDDRVDEIRALLETGRLARPGAEDVAAFEEAPETRLSFVIVQPYVVAQRNLEKP